MDRAETDVNSANVDSAMKQVLRMFVERGKTDNKLRLSSFCRCLQACGYRRLCGCVRASVWATHQDVNRKISIDYIVNKLIDAIAHDYVWFSHGAGSLLSGDGIEPNDPRVTALSWRIKKKIASRVGIPVHDDPGFDPIGTRLMQEGRLTGRVRRRLDSVDLDELDGELTSCPGARSLMDEHRYIRKTAEKSPNFEIIEDHEGDFMADILTDSVRRCKRCPIIPLYDDN